ncbi:DUF6591 domain-containing protein [Acetanaerobacterium elongatum]|uniref:DUF6591 domain-containing protein n=1 Tax=Acetanaerobacterium elongatum TaxID=258515 RepID=UPI000B89A9CF|nr:DUF6591 domain-containing protein [Acetanaerobacterium elongatum]
MKRIVAIVLVTLLLLSLAGCGIKEKIEQKVGEAITEGVINGAAGGDGKVDINGSQVTITGSDGATAVIGGTEWPSNQAGKILPKFGKGKIESVINSDESCWIQIEEVEAGDYDSYRKDLEAAGFTQNTFESADETSKMYTASKDEKTSVSITYSITDKTMIVMAGIKKDAE